MAHVVLTSSLRRFTGGETEFDIDVANVQQLLRELAKRYPALAPTLDNGLAIAIDGQIHQNALFAKIPPEGEVHLLPRIGGG